MDPQRFDRFVKSLSRAGSRRRLLSLLAALPPVGALATYFGDVPFATAKKKQKTDDDHGSSHRRHRRKAKHRHRTGKDKEHRKGKRNGQRKGKDTGKTSCAPAEQDAKPG